MNEKDKALVKMYKLAKKQSEIINKLSQVLPTAANPDQMATKNEAAAIMEEMDELTRAAVSDIWVTHDHVVKVKFHPGKGTDEAFQGVQNAVTYAASKNKLVGSSYRIEEVI